MLHLRPAVPADLDFLVTADLQTDFEEAGVPPAWSAAAYAAHRAKIAAFITAADKGALVAEGPAAQSVGMLLYRLRNRWHEDPAAFAHSILLALPADLFPPSGDFCEIFQLWVAPLWRRQGLARALKLRLEAVLQAQRIRLIYTHTLASFTHVLALNHQLGYREVRRGPIWDEAVRVSLVKVLGR